MRRKTEKCDTTVINEPTSSPSKSLEHIELETHPIIFCINPGDRHPKVGDKVTYDLVQGDNGQWYAKNIIVVSDKKPH
jgi:hypothetical protein